MHVKVDTSGWLDDFADKSAIGFSNGYQGAICLSKSLKFDSAKMLRKQGKSRAFCKARLFVIALFILLRPFANRITQITVDKDFAGWEGEIIDMLSTYLRRQNPRLTVENIRFDKLAGHHCHDVANGAYRGEFPCIDFDREELMRLVRVRTKK